MMEGWEDLDGARERGCTFARARSQGRNHGEWLQALSEQRIIGWFATRVPLKWQNYHSTSVMTASTRPHAPTHHPIRVQSAPGHQKMVRLRPTESIRFPPLTSGIRLHTAQTTLTASSPDTTMPAILELLSHAPGPLTLLGAVLGMVRQMKCSTTCRRMTDNEAGSGMAGLRSYLQYLLPPAARLPGAPPPAGVYVTVGMADSKRDAAVSYAEDARKVWPCRAYYAQAPQLHGCKSVAGHLWPFDRP